MKSKIENTHHFVLGITKGDTDDSFGRLLTNINCVRALPTARCCTVQLLSQPVWQNATHVKTSCIVMYST